MAYSLAMTTVLCWLFHFVPFLRLRGTEESEVVGLDDAELGEYAYDFVSANPDARSVHLEAPAAGKTLSV